MHGHWRRLWSRRLSTWKTRTCRSSTTSSQQTGTAGRQLRGHCSSGSASRHKLVRSEGGEWGGGGDLAFSTESSSAAQRGVLPLWSARPHCILLPSTNATQPSIPAIPQGNTRIGVLCIAAASQGESSTPPSLTARGTSALLPLLQNKRLGQRNPVSL